MSHPPFSRRVFFSPDTPEPDPLHQLREDVPVGKEGEVDHCLGLRKVLTCPQSSTCLLYRMGPLEV